ncbi:bifunctional enzyme IspD/IspF-like [Telopea speciosissima]|uniref:bifunctional enzyme IspD/IspF-like n=1 Tax=Telopea speciosissima TaxID=54955 RepID=UPI001CC6154B|nr:bifunctional enzyme IspD/IspF-like [Telopea speciosissima]
MEETAIMKIPGNEISKLEKFDGSFFKRWKGKMYFFLTALKLAHVLNEEKPVAPTLTNTIAAPEVGARRLHNDDMLIFDTNTSTVLETKAFLSSCFDMKDIGEANSNQAAGADHRLEPGYPLIIGGINIPYERGCEAHSDSDVLLHCVVDAILGACCALGLPDIGQIFPNNDPKWKGAASCVFIKEAVSLFSIFYLLI